MLHPEKVRPRCLPLNRRVTSSRTDSSGAEIPVSVFEKVGTMGPRPLSRRPKSRVEKVID